MQENSPRFRPVVGQSAAYKPGTMVAAPDGRSFKLFAQAAAVASLAAERELFRRVKEVVEERIRVCEALVAQGWPVPPTQGNFVWLGPGDAAMAIAGAYERAGVSVRPFAGDGVRVSVADYEANDAFLAIAVGYPRKDGRAR